MSLTISLVHSEEETTGQDDLDVNSTVITIDDLDTSDRDSIIDISDTE